jgi:O-antigen/teichoic acid export membrane protein
VKTKPGRPEPAEGPVAQRVARNATVVAAAEVAGKVATLAFTVAAARSLGPDGFGAFSYALSFALLLATLPAGGFGAILVQRGSREPATIPQLFSELLTWRTAIAIPVFGAAAIAGIAMRPDGSSVLAFLLVLTATFVDLYADSGRSVATALQRQTGVSLALVLQRFFTAALAIAALAAGMGLVALTATYLVGSVFGAVLVFRSVRRLGVHPSRRLIRRDSMRSMGRAAFVLGIDTVLSLALFRIDQVILGSLKGAHEVGVYAATYKLLETVLFVSWAMVRAVYPVMSASRDPDRVKHAVESGIAAIAVLYIPFGVGLFIDAPQILGALYTPEFVAPDVARWLAASPMLFAIGFLFSYGLVSRERRWRAAWGTIAATVLNLALNFSLIPHFGAVGAAAATTVSYLFEAIVLAVLAGPVFGWPRMDRALALPLIASTVMAAVLLALPDSLWIQVPAGIVVYTAAWFPMARRWAPKQLEVLRSLLPGRTPSRPKDEAASEEVGPEPPSV